MARSHARIFTSIWDDPDFLARSSLAQRFYMMLLSQPNLGHAGILPTTVRRWTLLSADEDEEALRRAMAEMTEHNFVVVDERTEELLIRSLIRNDGVWKQPKVLAVAITEAASIRSPLLRACVADELGRLDEVPSLPDKTRPEVEALLKDLPQRLANARLELDAQGDKHPPADPPPHPPADAGSNPGDEGSGNVLRARARAAPTPATVPVPSPVPPPADAAKQPRRRKEPPSEAHIGTVVAAYVDGATEAGLKAPPSNLRARVGKQARQLLGEGWDITILVESARRMGAGEYNDLTVQARRDDAAANGANARQSTSAQRAQQAVDAGARVQEMIDKGELSL